MPLQEPESRNILLILPKETLFFIQGTNRNEFSIFYCILKCKGKNTAVRVFKPVYTFRTRFAKSLQMQVCKWKHPMSHGHEDPWQVQLKGHSLLTVQQYSAKKTPKAQDLRKHLPRGLETAALCSSAPQCAGAEHKLLPTSIFSAFLKLSC